MKKRMKHFQKEEFDLDGAGPAQPSGGPPYIRWPFRWACCNYLTFVWHVLNFLVLIFFAVFCPYHHFAEPVAFIWLWFAMYLTFLLLIFLLFFSISPFRSLRGWHLLDVCLLFWHLFDIFDTFHIFAKYKQSLKVSKKNPWVINIQQW